MQNYEEIGRKKLKGIIQEGSYETAEPWGTRRYFNVVKKEKSLSLYKILPLKHEYSHCQIYGGPHWMSSWDDG